MLEEAILIATRAHMGQVDKGNQPYILHPLRVMLRLQTEEERTVGVLHDVIEDTSVTIEDLRKQGISKEVLEALEHITKGKQEPYMEYISRVIQNP